MRKPKEAAGGDGMNRREFIVKVGATSVVAAATVAEALAVPPKTRGAGKTPAQTPIPSAPPPSPSNSAIQARVDQVSGIPLGGIGTGSIEVRADGYFHEWQIFNTGRWAPSQPEHERGGTPDMPPGAFAFFLRTKQGQEVKLRRLGTRADQNDLYSLGWAKNVEGIEFDGRFPGAKLSFQDTTLPVAVEEIVFSPFVPHDSQTSGTPGCNLAFRLKNRSSKPVEVSLLSLLRNPVASGADDRMLRLSVDSEGGATFLTMRTDAHPDRMSSIGSLCLAATGGKASWIAGDFRRYLSNGGWVDGRYGNCHESFLRGFRDSGRLPSLPAQSSPQRLLMQTEEQIKAMSTADKAAAVAQMKGYAWFLALAERVDRVDPELLKGDAGMGEFLVECRNRLFRTAGEDRKGGDWGDSALCCSVSLKPGEEKEVRFALGWFFPHHFSARGPEMGHRYEAWFKDARDVAGFLVANHDVHRRETLAFANALHDTTLGTELASAWTSQLSTLVKCSWWTKNGQFAIWEGLGCCGFHTTDITYQGSFGILAIFPELQKAQMSMGAAYQRADGRVHHFFTPDLAQVDNGFDRVDMNPQFVMLVCRDYLWTGDLDYLKAMWPHIQRAMNNTAQLDADGDGLPDHDTSRNTYDAWEFFGTPSYIASLWLGALRAAIRMAGELGDNASAAQWRDTLDRGAAAFEKRLWNGEYYSLWADTAARDECCMSDQMSGEWFTNLIGLGHALPRERVLAAMKAIVKHNFSPELGLLNATYPAERPARFTTYQNGQAAANWTGIEYAIGSMMMDFGMVSEGLAVVSSVHDRYARAGRNWNHVECGDHYYRAMCSWSTLLAATGFKLDVPRQMVVVAPPFRQARLVAPWVAPTAWGTFSSTADSLSLRCEAGNLGLRHLATRLAGKTLKATLAGAPVKCVRGREGGLTLASFDRAVTVSPGQELVVRA